MTATAAANEGAVVGLKDKSACCLVIWQARADHTMRKPWGDNHRQQAGEVEKRQELAVALFRYQEILGANGARRTCDGPGHALW